MKSVCLITYKKALALAFFLCLAPRCYLLSCTMSPSVWGALGQTEELTEAPSAYALSEAFFQLKTKFERECRAAGFAIKPLAFVSMLGENKNKIPLEAYNNIVKGIGAVYNNAEILPFGKLKSDFYKCEAGGERFAASISVSKGKTTLIYLVDLNPQVYALLRFVIRDEVKVLLRVADSEGLPIFLDEVLVSPTIIIDSLISPWGGFLIRFEKNNSRPIVIDFGSIDDSKIHVMRINTGYNQPEGAPFLKEFNTELLRKVTVKANNERLLASLVYAIQSKDYELYKLFFESYPNFNINLKGQNGYTPLHYAAKAGCVPIITDLLNRGANKNAVANGGETVLGLALKSGVATAVVILNSNGAP